VALSSVSANDQRARVLMQAAEAKAKIEGDLNAAIKLYKDAEKEAGSNRALVAQALVEMAEAYAAMGNAEAQKIYQRLVRDFADQKEAAELASARLVPTQNRREGAMLKDVPGFALPGNVTADGRYAAHIIANTGNIGVRDLRTGTSREVTKRQDFVVQDPIISRDGRFIAYQAFNGCTENRPATQPNGELCVIAIEGEPNASAKTVLQRNDIREITPMDWSPDGGLIAVVLRRVDGTAQIGLVSRTMGSLTVLQSTDWRGATRSFFSPDGRYLAFDVPANADSDDLDLRVVAVDGSVGSTLVQHSSQNVVMGWTPDGRHVLFTSDRTGSLDLWAQRVNKGKPDGIERLVHPGFGGAWSLGITSAGSLYFSVQSGSRDIEVLTLDLAAAKQVSTASRPIDRYVGTNWMPQWSRDGKFLAYVSRRGFSGNSIVIGIRESATGSVRELRPKLTYVDGLTWAPDNSILLTNGRDFRGRSGIFSIDTGTGEAKFVVDGGFPSYTADGSRLYYLRSMKPGGGLPRSIVERDMKSGTERTVATGEFLRVTLSPDDRQLAAASGGVGGAADELILIAAATGEIRRLYQAQPGDNIPTGVSVPWTPDGQAVLMRKRPPLDELWLVPTTGAPPRKIEADVKGWQFGTAGVISVHPDGRQLAATRIRQDTGASIRVLENFLSFVK
jgi:Tol biopolymer transport system component